ncbi:DUF305 domain-containing protein [Streptomyces sp. MBT84]|uniref:DUF305 domain-containing protein n=1 Tax=Streptomyces sp. MBT84 TaxID=1488414 RepID=UPI0035AB9B78
MGHSDTTSFSQEMNQSMQAMTKAMAGSSMTGDPDHDFAAMMVPHHQGAIAMSKAVLEHGKDPVLRRLAQEIIVTQQQEIAVMEGRLSARSASPRKASLPGTPSGAQRRSSTDPADPDIPISSQDRVYTSDQTSNTVSVINPATNRLLGVIRLGDPVPGSLSPLYKNQLLVHGAVSPPITGRWPPSPSAPTRSPSSTPPPTRSRASCTSAGRRTRRSSRPTAKSCGPLFVARTTYR